MYEAKAGIRAAASMHERFIELKTTNCFVDHAMQLPPQPAKRFVRIRRALHAVFVGAPLRLGRLAQKIGLKLDDIASWLIGTVLIIVVILAVLGLVNALDVVSLIKRALGIQ